jgi:DNA-binding NarL/FixJ family response regulator
LETIDLLRQVAGRTEIIMRACQKINEGILELSGALAPVAPTPPGKDLSVLTRRHREIFELIAQQLPTVDIAKRLKLSPRTVDSHRDTIRRRLGFATAAELNEFAKLHAKG